MERIQSRGSEEALRRQRGKGAVRLWRGRRELTLNYMAEEPHRKK